MLGLSKLLKKGFFYLGHPVEKLLSELLPKQKWAGITDPSLIPHLTEIYHRYLKLGIIKKIWEQSEHAQAALVDHWAVTKSTGGARMIMDFRSLNSHLKTLQKFSLLKAEEVEDYLYHTAYLTSLDVKDAYNHLRPHKDNPPVGMVLPEIGPVPIKGMLFGFSHAPRIWIKVLRSVLKPLRMQAILILDYFDDLLIISKSPAEAVKSTTTVWNHLMNLGILINKEKSQLTPTQELGQLKITCARMCLFTLAHHTSPV